MFARLTLLEGPPERYDDAVRTIREQALPGLREIPGLVASYIGFDRATGKAMGLSIFDTEESLHTSEEVTEWLRKSSGEAAGAHVVAVERYEIVGHI